MADMTWQKAAKIIAIHAICGAAIGMAVGAVPAVIFGGNAQDAILSNANCTTPEPERCKQAFHEADNQYYSTAFSVAAVTSAVGALAGGGIGIFKVIHECVSPTPETPNDTDAQLGHATP